MKGIVCVLHAALQQLNFSKFILPHIYQNVNRQTQKNVQIDQKREILPQPSHPYSSLHHIRHLLNRKKSLFRIFFSIFQKKRGAFISHAPLSLFFDVLREKHRIYHRLEILLTSARRDLGRSHIFRIRCKLLKRGLVVYYLPSYSALKA